MVDVIILNGGSSSGKTTIARCLQNSLSTSWLRFSIDDLIDAMPDAMVNADSGIKFGDDGSVSPGTGFRTLESAWMHGIGEMVRRGAQVIIDDVFISGVEACNRWFPWKDYRCFGLAYSVIPPWPLLVKANEGTALQEWQSHKRLRFTLAYIMTLKSTQQRPHQKNVPELLGRESTHENLIQQTGAFV